MYKINYIRDEKDTYENYTFSAQKWSAPMMESVNEIKEGLESLNLVGRKIKELRMIGLAYNLRRYNIEDIAYNFWKDKDEDERAKLSEYDNIDPSITIEREVEIDEPFLIKFDDGDVFEIDVPQQPIFRFSMNCIPQGIHAGVSEANAEANIIFEPCIGMRIEFIEVKTCFTDRHPMYGWYYDEEHSKREIVSGIVLWLENGIGILISGLVDFCCVSLIDSAGKNIPISFGILKNALFNPEDLCTDPLTGFEAVSYSLKFGKLGAEHTETPYISLVPGDKDTKLHISVEDFILFDWAISTYTSTKFDEYDDYEFSYNQWSKILKIAGEIVSIDNFDDLFEFLTGIKITGRGRIDDDRYSFMLYSVNCYGADFWKRHYKYETQLNDMIDWTEIVLSTNEKMSLCGF